MVAALALVGSVLAPLAAAENYGGELIIIHSVSASAVTTAPGTGCGQQSGLVLPVAIVAAFIPPPGAEVAGPYAGADWSGGGGVARVSFHNGNHDRIQVFHMLLPVDPAYYHGPDVYMANVVVQDPSLSIALAFRDDIPVMIPGQAPSHVPSVVKCDADQIGFGAWAQHELGQALGKVLEEVCPLCSEAQTVFDEVVAYSELLDLLSKQTIKYDPPDLNFQQIAQPAPPPILAPPAGLTTAQQVAYMDLVAALADTIGASRALATSLNRVWGADNAGDVYWHQRQMAAVASFSAQVAAGYDRLPARFAALQAALAPVIPDVVLTPRDQVKAQTSLADGLPPAHAALLTQLGVSDADQGAIRGELLAVDDAGFVPVKARDALADPGSAGYAEVFRSLGAWASSDLQAAPPSVIGVSPSVLPSWGGTVTLQGTNLKSVTAVNVGPSTPYAGQATLPGGSCDDDTACTVNVPPGRGTADVVAIGPGGPSRPSAAARVTYVAPPKPVITAIAPTSGSLEGGTEVAIHGAGLSGAWFSFGATAVGAEPYCPRDDTCFVQSPPSALPGTMHITAVTEGGTSATGAADLYSYVVTPPASKPPTVTGVSPASGSSLGGDHITVTGSGFLGTTDVMVGRQLLGYGYGDYDVIDDAHLSVVTPSGSGTADIVVTDRWGRSSASSPADVFTYRDPVPPTVTGVSPSSAPNIGGTKVTVTGQELSGGRVRFEAADGGVFPNDSVCDTTSCTTTTPPSPAGPVTLSVETDNGTSASVPFTFTLGPSPSITAVSPPMGMVGDSIAVLGQNLAGGTVWFGDRPISDSCLPTVCLVQVPEHDLGPVGLAVTTYAGKTAITPVSVFTYLANAAPVVSGVASASGGVTGGDNVRVLGWNLNGGEVFFGAEPAGGTCGPTQCSVDSPPVATPGAVDVTVTTDAGTSVTSAADRYTYLQPTIIGMAPASGWTAGGTTVTISGTSLTGPWGSEIWFGSVRADDAACSPTSCTVTAPAAVTAGPVDVQVVNALGTSPVVAAGRYTYQVRPPPTVTAVSPAAGTRQGNDLVTITGSNLDGGTVAFGDKPGAQVACSPTTCTVRSPAAVDGPVHVTVTTPAGTSAVNASDLFTYRGPGIPTVTGVDPSTGSVQGGTTVTITGKELTNARVDFGGVPSPTVTCTAASCTAIAPPGSVGIIDIRAITDGGTSAIVAADRFTYQLPPVPTVDRVDPMSGPSSGGKHVTITGSALLGATVTFGGIPATGGTCAATSCRVTAPPGAPGAVDVVATTAGGSSVASVVARFTYTPVAVAQRSIPDLAGNAGGGHLTRGVGTDIWFTVPDQSKVVKATSDGSMTAFTTPTAAAAPIGITLGPDGRIWYTEQNANTVVAIDGAGIQTEYPVPGVPFGLRDITSGPDGRLWFTMANSGVIGAMTTTGQVSAYPVPNPGSFPLNIVVGGDGRLWFTEPDGNAIGAITTSGVATEYPVPTGGSSPWGISRGPDGRIWFAESNGRALGAVTTQGEITEYPVFNNPQGITDGPDGRLWFTDPSEDKVGAFDPATGTVEDIPIPGAHGVKPKYLTMGRDASVLVSEISSTAIARVTGLSVGRNPAITFVNPTSGPVSGGTVVTLSGANLGGATAVQFGAGPATSVTVVDPARVTAVAPAGASGMVDIRVTTPAGTTPVSVADRFWYGSAPPARPVVTGISPASGSTTGGSVVTVAGSALAGGTVRFGAASAAAAVCTDRSCTVTAPPGAVGPVDVTVTTPGGTSARSDGSAFVYLAPAPPAPVVAGVSPSTGPPAGGTTVTVAGANLSGGIVRFGLASATGVCGATSCTATAPPGDGIVDVTVTTAGGTSAVGVADRFTYGAAKPGPPTAVVAVAGRTQATVSWTAPISSGVSPITGYTVSSSDDDTLNCSWTSGPLTCVVSGLDADREYTFVVRARNSAGFGAPSAPSNLVIPWDGSGYHPVTPTRILDSRGTNGGWNAKLGAGRPRTLQVTDRGGVSNVPTTATGVVMNVTVTNGTAGSFVTVYPAGSDTPNASNLNFGPGQTIANLVTVKLGPAGRVDLANAVGATDVIADVVGYYDDGNGPGDLYTGITPTRLLDSRGTTGGWNAKLTAGSPRDLAVRQPGNPNGVPATATAVIANVTVTGSTNGSFLSVWPSGLAQPNVSNLNFAAGQTIPNLAIIKIGANGAIRLANEVGGVDVIVDVVGYFDPTGGSRFHAIDPTRVLDDRVGTGLRGPWTPGATRALDIGGGVGTNVPDGSTGVVINVTATGGTAGSFITVFPSGVALPNSSNVNFGAGETIPNLVTVKLSSSGAVSFYNKLGNVDIVADAVGYYAPT